MTFGEWAEKIVGELKDAGFTTATLHEGFPLVPEPLTFAERYKLLKFQSSMSCDRHLYKEGLLFMPPRSKA